MRVEELSIGDFLFFTDGDCAVRVEEIYNDAQLLISDGDSISEPVHLTHLHPIPLTPEILEKNGVHFVENFEDDEYLFACPSFSVIWLKGRGEWKFCVPNAWMYIRSVHELQHALRLAGIDKEIEL